MTKLSVNINKIATLRNARGGNNPDVEQVAKDCEAYGAEGITVHPRPDERHIRYADVYALRPQVKTEFNIEGYPSKEFIDLVLRVRPHQVTLVPDAPNQITSNAGWDTKTHFSFLTDLMDTFGTAGIRTSIFCGNGCGNDRVCSKRREPTAWNCIPNLMRHFIRKARNRPLLRLFRQPVWFRRLGMGLNAGHDLSLQNLKYFHDNIPWLDEVSIGHALICDALYLGLQKTIEEYKNCLR